MALRFDVRETTLARPERGLEPEDAVFHPAAVRAAFPVRRGRRWFALVDGVLHGPYDGIGEGTLGF